MLDLKSVKVSNPEGLNFILGQSHFIKTVEDLYEALAASTPGIKFGLAFCEASGACKVRCEGNDPQLVKLAGDNALEIGCGHSFIVFVKNAYPLNILNSVKSLPEVCSIYCATANPVEVLIAETGSGRGILGVIDGAKPAGIETAEDVSWRKQLLRKIGYKL